MQRDPELTAVGERKEKKEREKEALTSLDILAPILD